MDRVTMQKIATGEITHFTNTGEGRFATTKRFGTMLCNAYGGSLHQGHRTKQEAIEYVEKEHYSVYPDVLKFVYRLKDGKIVYVKVTPAPVVAVDVGYVNNRNSIGVVWRMGE